LVNKNVLSCLLKDGKEVNAVMLVGRLFHARVPSSVQMAVTALKLRKAYQNRKLHIDLRKKQVSTVKTV